MSNTIGGFSKQQYESYVNPSLEAVEWKSTHWVGHFNLARYPIIPIAINRLAYWILHGFRTYPNNVFMFEKFKQHDLKALTSEQYEAAKDIFTKFQGCPEIDQNELDVIDQSLKDLHAKFPSPKAKEEGGVTDEKKPSKPVTKEKEDQKRESEGNNSEPKKKDTQTSETPKGNSNSSSVVSPKPGSSTAVLPASVSSIPTVTATPVGVTQVSVPAATPPPVLAPPPQNPAKIEQQHIVQLPLSAVLDDKKQAPIEPPKTLATPVVEPETPKKVLEPIPNDVHVIISTKFPLSNQESILDLYKKGNEKRLESYRKNLIPLLDFAHELHKKNKQTDVKFTEYMQKVDQAHQRALVVVNAGLLADYEDFVKEFGTSANLQENGEVMCTPMQIEWVQKRILTKYQALYELSFDAPAMGIDQEKKMASLARKILCGSAVKKFPEPSTHFIRIGKVDSMTPTKTYQLNSFNGNGSYLSTQIFGKGKVVEDKSKVRELVESFVTNWFQRMGTTLKISGVTIQSGQSTEAIKAEDWVVHVRDAYTAYLKGLDGNQLKKLIDDNKTCPFGKAMKESFGSYVEGATGKQSSNTSMFKKEFLKNVMKAQLEKAGDDSSLKQAIQKTIDFSDFADPKDIAMLAEKAECDQFLIEPLIRIRVFYLMTCLGDSATQLLVDVVNDRTGTFFDPEVSNIEEPSLSLEIKEKTLEFDPSLDQLVITIKNSLEDFTKDQSIAQFESTFTISSISQPESKIKASVVDMQNLALSTYASKIQCDFFKSQLAPKELMEDILKLEIKLGQLEIVKKAKKYEEAKKTHKTSWVSVLKSVDKSPYINWHNDKDQLFEVLQQVRSYVSYLSTEQILMHKGQLEDFNEASKQKHYDRRQRISDDFERVYQLFQDLYPLNVKKPANDSYTSSFKELGYLISIKEEQLKVNTSNDEIDDEYDF